MKRKEISILYLDPPTWKISIPGQIGSFYLHFYDEWKITLFLASPSGMEISINFICF